MAVPDEYGGSIPITLDNVTAVFNCDVTYGVDYSNTDALYFKMTAEALYFVIALVALVQFIRIHLMGELERNLTPQKLFHILILLVNIVRIVTLPIPVRQYDKMSIFANFVVSTLPGTMYWSAYLLLFLYWAAVYYRAVRLYDSNYKKTTLIFYIIVNILGYSSMIGLGLYLDKTDSTYARMVRVSGLFIGSLSLMTVIVGAMYFCKVCVKLNAYPIVSSHSRISMVRVGLVTAVCVVAFLIKAPAIVYMNDYLCENRSVSYTDYEIITCCYLFCVDILPAALVLYLIRMPAPRTQNHPKVNSSQRYVDSPMNKSRDSFSGDLDAVAIANDEFDPLYQTWNPSTDEDNHVNEANHRSKKAKSRKFGNSLSKSDSIVSTASPTHNPEVGYGAVLTPTNRVNGSTNNAPMFIL